MKEESTHIQTMIHKRQLKTRRFLVLSGFYVLMYMNLDEKANYSSERTGNHVILQQLCGNHKGIFFHIGKTSEILASNS